MAEVRLRRAQANDLPEVAGVYLRARHAAFPEMPAAAHSDDEIRAWIGQWHADDAWIWLAEEDDADGGSRVIGFARVDGDWLHSLYVAPQRQRDGIGSALLDLVKTQCPDGFSLWVFESNRTARHFYRQHDLVAVRRTDGSGNQEGSPDFEMRWPGTRPLDDLRAAIDRIDEDLARLLELRAGVTAAIQSHKGAETGRAAPRDPDREAEIVARMSAFAPRLGPDRMAAIMRQVIAQSLDTRTDPTSIGS
ncbi:MAG: GNAT family N-acetyltransferase [Nocardioides sp.]